MTLQRRVRSVEVGPRDGLQDEAAMASVAVNIELMQDKAAP